MAKKDKLTIKADIPSFSTEVVSAFETGLRHGMKIGYEDGIKRGGYTQGYEKGYADAMAEMEVDNGCKRTHERIRKA